MIVNMHNLEKSEGDIPFAVEDRQVSRRAQTQMARAYLNNKVTAAKVVDSTGGTNTGNSPQHKQDNLIAKQETNALPSRASTIQNQTMAPESVFYNRRSKVPKNTQQSLGDLDSCKPSLVSNVVCHSVCSLKNLREEQSTAKDKHVVK